MSNCWKRVTQVAAVRGRAICAEPRAGGAAGERGREGEGWAGGAGHGSLCRAAMDSIRPPRRRLKRHARDRSAPWKNPVAQTRDWIATARTLSEALPYLQRYDGATIVIKLGGHAMGSDAAMDEFARDVVLMKQCNVNPVVVHGGGPMINDMLKRLDIRSEFVDGKRVSDAATVEVVEMVLSGRINKRIVQAINAQGGKAIGLSRQGRQPDDLREGPEDGRARRQAVAIDLGFVGRPVEVNPEILASFLGSDFIPVMAPIGAGRTARPSTSTATPPPGRSPRR